MKITVLMLTIFQTSFLFASTINHSESGIAFEIPEGWVEIPNDIIKQHFDEIKKQRPNLTIPNFDWGFQKKSGKWLSYPYILVQMNRSGRLPAYQLSKIKMIDNSSAGKKIESQSNNFIKNAKMGEMVYDSIAKIIWQEASMNVDNFGKVNMLMGMHLIKNGTMNMYGYSAETDIEKYRKTFENIIMSANIADSLKYKANLEDNEGLGTAINILKAIDWSKVADKALIGGIIGALAATIGLFFRKRRISKN